MDEEVSSERSENPCRCVLQRLTAFRNYLMLFNEEILPTADKMEDTLQIGQRVDGQRDFGDAFLLHYQRSEINGIEIMKFRRNITVCTVLQQCCILLHSCS